MFQFNHLISKPQIGLDIQATEICFLQLRCTKQNIRIEQAARIALPEGAIVDGKIQRFDVVSSAVQKPVEQTKTWHSSIAVALPTQCVITKKIQLMRGLCESARAKEVAENLHSYFPEVTDELAHDYTVLNQDDPIHDNVLIMATRYDQLTSYVGVIEQAGLKVKIVDIDLYALIRAIHVAIPHVSDLPLITLLNMGEMMTQLIVMHKNEIIFHQQFINGAITDLCVQINCALQLYFSNYKQLQIQKILLSGSIVFLQEIRLYIYQELGIDTQYINPFNSMSISPRVNSEKLLTYKMLICCGLALRGMNG